MKAQLLNSILHSGINLRFYVYSARSLRAVSCQFMNSPLASKAYAPLSAAARAAAWILAAAASPSGVSDSGPWVIPRSLSRPVPRS